VPLRMPTSFINSYFVRKRKDAKEIHKLHVVGAKILSPIKFYAVDFLN